MGKQIFQHGELIFQALVAVHQVRFQTVLSGEFNGLFHWNHIIVPSMDDTAGPCLWYGCLLAVFSDVDSWSEQKESIWKDET